jgi:hypothetical protein
MDYLGIVAICDSIEVFLEEDKLIVDALNEISI